MTNKDHKQGASSFSITMSSSTVMAGIAVITGALSVVFFISKLHYDMERLDVDKTLSRITNVEKQLLKVAESDSDALDRLSNKVASDFATLENRLLTVASDSSALENQLSKAESDSNERIAAVESRLLDVANKLRQTVSRVPALETGSADLSADIASRAFNTVYVFKHTFDFPDPPFDVNNRDEAEALLCSRRRKLQATGELPEEGRRYVDELHNFDDHVELNFYTMGKGSKGDDEPQAIIRQETACYKHMPRENAGPAVAQDVRVTPAPVRISMRVETGKIDNDNSTIYSQPYEIAGDHYGGDSKTFEFTGFTGWSDHAGLQVHALTAAVSDRSGNPPIEKYCESYGFKVATGELDRCDFELFIFTHLNPAAMEE